MVYLWHIRGNKIMLYYRIEASILNIEELDLKGKENVFAMSAKERSHIFYQKHNQRLYLFVSYIRKNCVVLGGIARDKNILHDVLDTFWDYLDLKIENLHYVS